MADWNRRLQLVVLRRGRRACFVGHVESRMNRSCVRRCMGEGSCLSLGTVGWIQRSLLSAGAAAAPSCIHRAVDRKARVLVGVGLRSQGEGAGRRPPRRCGDSFRCDVIPSRIEVQQRAACIVQTWGERQ